MHNSIWLDEVGAEPTSPQYAVLEILSARPGLAQRTVADLAYLDKSSTMDIVQRLTRNQWISRERDPRDARRDVLRLTPAASHAVSRLRTAVDRVQDKLLDPLHAGSRVRFLGELVGVARINDSLDNPVQRIPGHLVRRAQQVHTALLAERLGGGITGPQLATIFTLESDPGIDQRTLGEAAALDKSTTADIVARLHGRGWIERSRDPRDGRRRVLELAESGLPVARDLAPRVAAIQEELLAPLAEEQRPQFLSDLDALAHPSE